MEGIGIPGLQLEPYRQLDELIEPGGRIAFGPSGRIADGRADQEEVSRRLRPHDEWGSGQRSADYMVECLRPTHSRLALFAADSIVLSTWRRSWQPILVAASCEALIAFGALIMKRPSHRTGRRSTAPSRDSTLRSGSTSWAGWQTCPATTQR